MKASIWHISLVLLAAFGLLSTHSTSVYGQEPTVGHNPASQASSTTADGGVASIGSCAQPPCSSLNTGRKYSTPPPGPRVHTAAELEEMRYGRLFGELEGLEQAAQREEAAGHSDVAASYRGYFAAKSGLTSDEAETVKKIAANYKTKWEALQSKLRAANQAIRPVKHKDPNGYKDSPEYAALLAVNQERDSLFPSVKAELISVLGSRSFTRLDSYTLHSHDNARLLNQGQSQSTTGQQGTTPGTTTAFRIGGI
jgi:hypothetical protein